MDGWMDGYVIIFVCIRVYAWMCVCLCGICLYVYVYVSQIQTQCIHQNILKIQTSDGYVRLWVEAELTFLH